MSHIATGFLRLFFRLLYHPFAWAYDAVASAVSNGRWKRWVLAAVPLLNGPRILELGFGPGHLQARLHSSGLEVYGLDESWQMAKSASRRLSGRKYNPQLTRGMAQQLPFASNTFQSVTATFPTLYIVDPLTLSEVMRVLVPGGRLVVLMTAWITGKSFRERALQKLSRVTAQVPSEDQDISEFISPYQEAGFHASLRFVEMPGSRLMFIVAAKPKDAV